MGNDCSIKINSRKQMTKKDMKKPKINDKTQILKKPIELKNGSKSKPTQIEDQVELATQFTQQYNFVYSEKIQGFECYNSNSGLWLRQTEYQVKNTIVEFLKRYATNHNCTGEINKKIKTLIGTIFELAKYNPTHFTQLDQRYMISVANGVLDLSGTAPRLLPHDPGYHFTSGSRIKYDSNAHCYLFTYVLLGQTLDLDDVSLLQKYIGSIFLGENDLQGILLLQGDSKSGKSSTVQIVEEIIGKNNVAQLRPGLLESRFETSSYIEKKLIVGSDVPSNFLAMKSAAVLKSLVGGDPLQAELKYRNGRQDLKRSYHVIINTNSNLTLPLDWDEDAWRRRMLIVNYQCPKHMKRINNIAALICEDELSGVLNWVIDGALAHKAEMDKYGEYRLTDQQKERVEKMIAGSKSEFLMPLLNKK